MRAIDLCIMKQLTHCTLATVVQLNPSYVVLSAICWGHLSYKNGHIIMTPRFQNDGIPYSNYLPTAHFFNSFI